MQYESKYLKYKLKYLKLYLSLQKGGFKEEIKWPQDLGKIKEGDKLKIINIYQYHYKVRDGDYNTRLQSLLKTKPTCIVYSVTPQEILLGFNIDTEYRISEAKFTLDEFPQGLLFEKDIPDTENLANEQVVPNNPNKNQAIPYDQKNDQVIPYNPIEYRINNLEKQIAVIEKRLTNHYHILPTSGMKDFEDSHPYYNRKLN